jgi:hypothetical protein
LRSCIALSHKLLCPQTNLGIAVAPASCRALAALLPWTRTAGVGTTARFLQSVKKARPRQHRQDFFSHPGTNCRPGAGPSAVTSLQVRLPGATSSSVIACRTSFRGFHNQPCVAHESLLAEWSTPRQHCITQSRRQEASGGGEGQATTAIYMSLTGDDRTCSLRGCHPPRRDPAGFCSTAPFGL